MEETRQLSGKRPKLSDGEQNMDSIDRLSSLPDDAICHILSFLPTKLSVATSVLGKRWRFLWAHVPCLDFSVFDFNAEGTQVSDIIDRVLLRHKAKRMDTLTLNNINCNEFQLETFITTAIERSIRNLYLELDFHTFPRYLFNCKTIVDLKLENNSASLSAVKNVSLPSLKKLYVCDLICENDDALPCFLSGCPSLEELIMKFTFVDYVGCINISSPTIKMLQIDCDYQIDNIEYRMIINVPALEYLEVYSYDLECITIPTTMISLFGADISFKTCAFSNLKTNDNSTVVKFLHSLCYVKCLVISGWELEEFVRRGVACSTVKFYNLKRLKVLWNFKWSVLVKFLEVADNLEILTLSGVYLDHFGQGYLCPEPEQVPKCLLSSLRTIVITLMEYKEHGFDMIRYLLRNSRVLERMELFSTCTGLKKQLEALKRISLFERGSSACQLDFLPDD